MYVAQTTAHCLRPWRWASAHHDADSQRRASRIWETPHGANLLQSCTCGTVNQHRGACIGFQRGGGVTYALPMPGRTTGHQRSTYAEPSILHSRINLTMIVLFTLYRCLVHMRRPSATFAAVPPREPQRLALNLLSISLTPGICCLSSVQNPRILISSQLRALGPCVSSA